METTSSSNSRIAKNTMMLYIRMMLVMAVTLYTSRVVLNTLGFEDFGIYNVVGGFVTMFAFLNSAMASATQRFLSFEIGRKDFVQLRNVFSMSVNIHFIIALVILFLAETIGLWFVNTQLTIPINRIDAAKWVYQFSIFTIIVNVISVPYNAIIIAHEKMNVFAVVSVVEVALKLLIVFVLQWMGFDKLKLYSVLMFTVALIIRIIYGLYCKRRFTESKLRIFWDKSLFKTLMSYAGWNLWGNAASVIMDQGVNILLNLFFAPTVNAARGIAYQVRGATYQFVANLQMAMNPQIIKSYASDNIKYMHQLIFSGSKYSFYLLFLISLPILLETDFVLGLWLKAVPEYTAIFTQLVIINILIDSVSGPLMTAAQASGKIKIYQTVVGGLLILNLPISFLFLKLGLDPQITMYVSIFISIIALFARLHILKFLVELKSVDFLNRVILRITSVCIAASIIPLAISIILDPSFVRFFIITITSVISSLVSIYFLGLNKEESLFFKQKAKSILKSLSRSQIK